ncbi:MAG: hypothetical protein KKD38_04585, partial [Candidatus Delongbacteria bacterium]|nr:hypothetical protein [Candidatus Delongbacteria bacterium]
MKFFEKLTLLFLIVLSCHLNARSAPDGNDSVTGVLTSDSKTVLPIQENRVHKAGLFWLNVTNNGYFGNPEGFIDPCTGLEAVRASMPGGSGQEYMFVSGLMFGGYLESDTIAVKTEAKAFEGPLVTTAFEDWSGNPMPRECWPIGFEDDPDGTVKGKIIETSNIQGKVSCLMQDVYDPSATANEQFSTWFSDKYVNRYYATGMDDYDKREHIPLGVEVKQKTYAWSSTYAEKFIIVDYTVYNKNEDGKDIYDFFMGIFSDFDVGINSREWTYFHSDDVGGFVHKWDKYIDPATGENKTVDLDIAWTADNDGRNYTGSDYFTASGEPSAGEPLNGAKGVIGIKVLKNPDPELKYSFNVFNNNSDESYDWGPRWKTGLHSDWKYDMTPEQKGYDDTNKDSLYNSAGQFQYGGRTEGRPLGDKGKYMVMSNNEIDHSFLDMREVYLGVFEDPDYLAGTPYAQADKWRKWEMNGGSDYVDGSAAELNNLANGNDVRFMLSFGPLGEKTSINVAVDTDLDSIPDNYINKEVWKFAYGDSLKFTLVYLTGEYFNYSLEQDPNYDNINIIDLNDGLDKTLYEQGWYDIFNSSVWVERIYDTPLFDTPVTKNGITKGDGWYGEDVGKDGLFADLNSGNMCWWLNEPYPGVDEGEGDNELTVFNSPNPDIYGWTAASEDDLLPYGNQDLTADFGSVVKYTKTDGLVPVNSMVRYGFDNKRLDSGDGVPDLQGPQAPPSPDIIVEKTAEEIIISWSSHQKDSEGNYLKIGSEHSIDNFSRINDFEGYKIMVSSEGDRESFISLFSIDKVNYSY